MFTDDLIDTSIPGEVRDVRSARISSEGIKLDGMIYHSSVQLVKEIMARSPGKRDRSGEVQRGNGRRSEERMNLDEGEPDALERARRRIAAWPTRGARASTTSTTTQYGEESRGLVREGRGSFGGLDEERYTDERAAVVHNSTSVERELEYGRDADEQTTDEEQSPIRRLDHSIHYTPRNQLTSRTPPSRNDQSSPSMRHRTATSQRLDPEDSLIRSTRRPDESATSRITPTRNDYASSSPQTRTTSLHPDSHNRSSPSSASPSSASPSSFQRRFREIQSQSPGKVTWGTDAEEENGRISGDGNVGVTRDRSGMMEGEMVSVRDGASGMSATRRETGVGSTRYRSGISTSETRDEALGMSKQRTHSGKGSAPDRSRVSMDEPASRREEGAEVSLHGHHTVDGRRSQETNAQDRRHVSSSNNTAHDELPAPPLSAREMSFAQIDHSTPVRLTALPRRGILISSEDDDTVDSTVSSSPVVKASVNDQEGLSRSILQNKNASREGVSTRDGNRSGEDVSRRKENTSGEGASRGGGIEETQDTLDKDISTQETTRTSRSVSFHAPPRTEDLTVSRSQGLETALSQRNADMTSTSSSSAIRRRSFTVRDQSEAPLEMTKSGGENPEVEREGATWSSGSRSRRSTAERGDRAEEPSRLEESEVELQTPPTATATLATTTSPSPRRKAPRPSGSPSRPSAQGTDSVQETSQSQSARTAESFFGVTLDPTEDGETSMTSFAQRTGAGQQSVGMRAPLHDGVQEEAGRASTPATSSNTARPQLSTDGETGLTTNAPLESAVGRHVLAWFETHKLLEHDRTIAERASAAAENELRAALRDAAVRGKERETEDANWIRWAAAGVVLILFITRLSSYHAPLSPSDEFYYTPLQTQHLASLRFSRHPLVVRLLVYALRWIVGEREVVRWLTWVGAGVPSAVVGRGRAFRVPV